jgi:hypothetical protein
MITFTVGIVIGATLGYLAGAKKVGSAVAGLSNVVSRIREKFRHGHNE